MANETRARKIKIGSMVWTIRIVPKDHADLDGAEGLTKAASCEILIASGQSREATTDTIFHEVLHAYMEASGLGHVLGALLKAGSEEERARAEEAVVRILSSSLRPALESAGWTPPRRLP